MRKLHATSTPDKTRSDPVLHFCATRRMSDKFEKIKTEHTLSETHAFDFVPQKILSKLSTSIEKATTDMDVDKKQSLSTIENVSCYAQSGGVVDGCGLDPIHKACAYFANDAEFIGKMVYNDPNCPNIQTKLLHSPVHRKWKSVEEGMTGTTKSAMPDDGQCAIHIALCNNPSVEVIKLLVESSPVPLSIPDCNGMLPLSLALRHFNSTTKKKDMESILDILITAYPQAMVFADKRMNTPLHYICMANPCQTKITRKQSPTSTVICGVSALSLSSSSDDQIIMNLAKKVAPLNPSAVHQRNFNGHTPLDLLQSRGGSLNDEMLTFLQELAFKEDEVEEVSDL